LFVSLSGCLLLLGRGRERPRSQIEALEMEQRELRDMSLQQDLEEGQVDSQLDK
jgi:hypothetical protein